jgi:O-antigen/teichoic acid export membrane protein
MNQAQRIAKNISVGGVSTSLGGLLQLATIVIIARFVGVADFGAFSFMFSFGFILERLADSGLNNILMRDMAVQRDRIGELLGGALTLVPVYILVVGSLMFAVIPFFHLDHRLAVLTAVMGFSRLSHVVIGCYGAVLLSQENWEMQAVGFVFHKIILLTLVGVAFLLGTGLTGVVVAHVLAVLPPTILFHFIVVKRYARPQFKFDPRLWKYLIRESVPVGGAGVVRLLAEQADIIIVTAMAGTVAAGLFSGPSRLASGLRYLPQTLILALFPLYSRAAAGADAQTEFAAVYERGVKWFAVFAFPLALPFLLCPAALTTGLLGSQYAPAIPAMRTISVAVWLIFASGPYFLLLTALSRQRFLFISTAAALVLRIGLDIGLTRAFSFLGPCIAMDISEGLLLVAWVTGVRMAGFPLNFVRLLWRPCVASVLMGLPLSLFASHSLTRLTLIILPANALYFASLYLLGAFSKEEIAQFGDALRFLGPFLAQWTRRERPPLERKAS